MMNIKKLIVLSVALTAIFGVAACGGGSKPDSPLPTSIPATIPATVPATETPTLPPIATETPAATVPPGATITPEPTVAPNPEEQIAQGEIIFTVSAGGIGCQACHGVGAVGLVGPDIRGRIASQVSGALEGVDAMQFIILTEAEIEAVAAYLQTLK